MNAKSRPGENSFSPDLLSLFYAEGALTGNRSLGRLAAEPYRSRFMLEAIKKDRKKQVIIILAVAFLLGMAVSGQYGAYVDQYTETNICGMNLKEYMYRLLGDDKPHDRMEYRFMVSFGNIGRITDSVEIDHGVAPYYPVGMLVFLQGRTAFSSYVWHYFTFVIYFAGCLALYGIVYELFRRRGIALLSFLMLYLSPRFFGEGHYNNKDIVLMAFGLLTLYFGVRYILRRKIGDGLLFAGMAAVMTNVKIMGLWFFGIVGITYLIYHIYKKTLTRKHFIQGLGAILFYVVLFMLITPASWNGLAEYIRYCVTGASSFSRWDGQILYAGEWYGSGELPWHYLPVQILISTPPVLLLFIAIGHGKMIYSIIRREDHAGIYGMILLSYLVPFVYVLLSREVVVYNGWRHFYFIYGPMMIAAGAGLRAAGDLPGILFGGRVKEHTCRFLDRLLCGGTVCYLLILILAGHPYQYSYVNCFAKQPAEDHWELDYWNVTGLQALKQLYNSSERNKSLDLTLGAVKGNQSAVITNLDLLPKKMREAMQYVNDEGAEPNYLVVNLSYGKMDQEGYHLLFAIESYGNRLFEVYERNIV